MVLTVIDNLAGIVGKSVAIIRKDRDTPVMLQLRFWDPHKKDMFEENFLRVKSQVKGLSREIVDEYTIMLYLNDTNRRAAALVRYIGTHVDIGFPNNVYLIAITGKREEREKLSKVLYRLGLRRGWLKQVFVKNLDEIIINRGLKFELLSLVYELRMYRDRLFIAAGTANFWPKGVESIKDALEEYLLPIEEARGYYIFVKSLRFRLQRDSRRIGIYSVDRWGRLIIGPHSNMNEVLDLFQEISTNIIDNYMEYKLQYNVRVDRVGAYTAYYLEKASSIYLNAVQPGPYFFNTAKLLVGKPRIWDNKLIILPVKVGNPRLTTRVIDKRNGMAVTLIVTYEGIKLIPAPGSDTVDAEMMDNVLAMFRNLISE